MDGMDGGKAGMDGMVGMDGGGAAWLEMANALDIRGISIALVGFFIDCLILGYIGIYLKQIPFRRCFRRDDDVSFLRAASDAEEDLPLPPHAF